MYSLNRKVVMISGASAGIGARLAEGLKRRGAQLSLVARREAKLREIGGPEAVITAGDVTDEAVRLTAIQNTISRWGRLDVLINNAGRGVYWTASSTPPEEARGVFDLNFFAPFALSQLATPYLRASRGSLVNISSIGGLINLPWLPIYSASKFALASLTSSQRVELKRDGVHVMGVFPGYVATDFQSNTTGPPPPLRVVKGRRFAVSPERCAEAIIRGIEKRRSNVVTPRVGWLLVLVNRWFPTVVESRMELI